MNGQLLRGLNMHSVNVCHCGHSTSTSHSSRRVLRHTVLAVRVLLLQRQSGGLDCGECRCIQQRGQRGALPFLCLHLVDLVPSGVTSTGVSSAQVWFSSTLIQRNPPHSGRPRAGSGKGTRSQSSFREGGHIQCSSSSERESGFYSRYFIVPKKDEGLHPIRYLHQLNLTSKFFFQNVETNCDSNQIRGLVCHNRS